MGDNWFDRLARAAGKGVSRREAVRGIVGGLLGAIGLGAAASHTGAARPPKNPPPCEPDVTKSPYFGGCAIVCSGYPEEEQEACVTFCVDCADPYFCPAGNTVDPTEPYGLVCSNGNSLTCCGKSPGAPVYRTCKIAGNNNFVGCVGF